MVIDAAEGGEESALDYGVSIKAVAGMEEDTTIVEASEVRINSDAAEEDKAKPWIGKRIVRRIKNRGKA